MARNTQFHLTLRVFDIHLFTAAMAATHATAGSAMRAAGSPTDFFNSFVDESTKSARFSHMGQPQVAIAGFKGLRSDLLVALRKDQPLTAGELGERFGLTANALRRHLKALEDGGVVRFRREARGVGGPVYEYSLTEQGEQLFPRSYANPLADALEIVRTEQGTEGVVRIFRRRWQALAEAAEPVLASLPLVDRARALVEMLSANGYMAEVESASPNDALIREHNCAVREIALRFPEVCTAEAAFIEEFLGTAVSRQSHMMHGCKSCEYTAHESVRLPTTRVQHVAPAAAAPRTQEPV